LDRERQNGQDWTQIGHEKGVQTPHSKFYTPRYGDNRVAAYT